MCQFLFMVFSVCARCLAGFSLRWQKIKVMEIIPQLG